MDAGLNLKTIPADNLLQCIIIIFDNESAAIVYVYGNPLKHLIVGDHPHRTIKGGGVRLPLGDDSGNGVGLRFLFKPFQELGQQSLARNGLREFFPQRGGIGLLFCGIIIDVDADTDIHIGHQIPFGFHFRKDAGKLSL